MFHATPSRGEPSKPTFELLTWNVGGLTADKVLEVLEHFRGSTELQNMEVVMLQEIITSAGSFHSESQHWQIVFGKCEGEFRGEGVAHRTTYKHQRTVVMPGRVATTVVLQRRHIRVLSGHIPHHATIQHTATMLQQWGDTLQGRTAVLGMDANETFRPPMGDRPGCYACTGRGEVVLDWLLSEDLKLPPQDLHTPSYYPYNPSMRPRRLDYLATRGGTAGAGRVVACKDRAASDHDGVAIPLGFHRGGGAARATWGPRKLRPESQISLLLQVPPPQGQDLHHTLATLAKAITVPGGGADTFKESKQLIQLRKQAQQAPAGAEARQQWKSVSRLRKQEFRQWKQAKAEQAAHLDWRALRSLQQTQTHRGWQLQLTDDPEWQTQLRKIWGGSSRSPSRPKHRPGG